MITEPICGRAWLRQHQYQYSQAEIDALGIELKVNGKVQFKTDSSSRHTRGVIKNIVRLNREDKL